jgi:nitrogen-specific signal transduction histidine kinase
MGDPLQIQIPQRLSVQTSSQLNTHIQKLLSQVAYQQDSESDDNNEQQLQSPILNATYMSSDITMVDGEVEILNMNPINKELNSSSITKVAFKKLGSVAQSFQSTMSLTKDESIEFNNSLSKRNSLELRSIEAEIILKNIIKSKGKIVGLTQTGKRQDLIDRLHR